VTAGRFFQKFGGNRGVTPLAVELSSHQEEALVADEEAVVGQCIFTSWHQDIRRDFPNCRSGRDDSLCGRLPLVGDETLESWSSERTRRRSASLPLTADFFRMKVGFNSNVAAVDLVDYCLKILPEPSREEHFERACMHTFENSMTPGTQDGFTTQWRRSDPSVCAASIRLAECNCGVDVSHGGKGDGKLGEGDILIGDKTRVGNTLYETIATAIVPNSRRGFPLGNWEAPDDLPSGCRYVTETGHVSEQDGGNSDLRTLVACELTAGMLLTNTEDVKKTCRNKYAQDVVVHVPVPAKNIVCEPENNDAKHGSVESCGTQPWVIGQETPAGAAQAVQQQDGEVQQQDGEVQQQGGEVQQQDGEVQQQDDEVQQQDDEVPSL